ncbi:MAG: type II toxin-antitoxin system ParD family antitoxin [Acidobacteria bacterium]|nr:type II toxin-antitoxin system ParD family antitoxin [Acidobacteriota bacterium]
MNVSLTPELEKFIENKVKSGRYHTASEVVRESLRLLEREDQLLEFKRNELRREIEKGVEQIRNGECLEVNSDGEWRQFLEDVKARGRARRADRAESK